MCTPGMGVNLWGESPLSVNPVNVLNTLTKVLAEGKSGIVSADPQAVALWGGEERNSPLPDYVKKSVKSALDPYF